MHITLRVGLAAMSLLLLMSSVSPAQGIRTDFPRDWVLDDWRDVDELSDLTIHVRDSVHNDGEPGDAVDIVVTGQHPDVPCWEPQGGNLAEAYSIARDLRWIPESASSLDQVIWLETNNASTQFVGPADCRWADDDQSNNSVWTRAYLLPVENDPMSLVDDQIDLVIEKEGEPEDRFTLVRAFPQDDGSGGTDPDPQATDEPPAPGDDPPTGEVSAERRAEGRWTTSEGATLEAERDPDGEGVRFVTRADPIGCLTEGQDAFLLNVVDPAQSLVLFSFVAASEEARGCSGIVESAEIAMRPREVEVAGDVVEVPDAELTDEGRGGVSDDTAVRLIRTALEHADGGSVPDFMDVLLGFLELTDPEFAQAQGLPVFLATDTVFADGLSVAGAAGALRAVTLLIDPGDLLANERRLAALPFQPTELIVAGGTAAIPDAVIPDVGVPVRRVSGPNRYATAVALTQLAFPEPVRNVWVATGQNFPDALGGGAAAAAAGEPLVLVDGGRMPEETAAELARLQPDQIFVLGGEAVIPPSMIDELEQFGRTIRLAGANRIQTALQVSAERFGRGAPMPVLVDSGTFQDALVAASAAWITRSPVLLFDANPLPQNLLNQVETMAPAYVQVLTAQTEARMTEDALAAVSAAVAAGAAG